MRYLFFILFGCALAIFALGHHVHETQLSKAQKNAKNLRQVLAKVEEIQAYRCKGRCYRTIVSYVVEGEAKLSAMGGNSMHIGQTLTVWVTPNFKQAYVSPDAFISATTPMVPPTWILFLPLVAILGSIANTKLADWRSHEK